MGLAAATIRSKPLDQLEVTSLRPFLPYQKETESWIPCWKGSKSRIQPTNFISQLLGITMVSRYYWSAPFSDSRMGQPTKSELAAIMRQHQWPWPTMFKKMAKSSGLTKVISGKWRNVAGSTRNWKWCFKSQVAWSINDAPQPAGELLLLLLLLLRPMTSRWQTRMTLMMVGGCDNVLPLNELNAMPFSWD